MSMYSSNRRYTKWLFTVAKAAISCCSLQRCCWQQHFATDSSNSSNTLLLYCRLCSFPLSPSFTCRIWFLGGAISQIDFSGQKKNCQKKTKTLMPNVMPYKMPQSCPVVQADVQSRCLGWGRSGLIVEMKSGLLVSGRHSLQRPWATRSRSSLKNH